MTTTSDTPAQPARLRVVHVSGELDIATGPELVEFAATVVNGDAPEELILDLGNVSLLDASGIAALLSIRRLTAAADSVVRLRDVPPRVMRVITLTNLVHELGAEPLIA